MRTILLSLFAIGCGGSYELEPQYADGECTTLDCPLLGGGEVLARAVFYSDVEETVSVARVSVSPPDIAEAYVEGGWIVIHPAPIALGTEPSVSIPNAGVLTVELAGGTSFDREFTVGAYATTSLVPSRVPIDALPARKLPGERLALFLNDGVFVKAEHRAIDGSRLLGHTSDVWSAELLQMAELDESQSERFDRQLFRRVRASSLGPGSVRLGTATLPVDVVPAGTTDRIELAVNGSPVDTSHPLTVTTGSMTRVSVIAYASDGRFIYGGPPYLPLEVVSSNLGIIGTADRAVVADREIWLQGYGPGSATLTFRFDGTAIDVPVTVN